MRECFQFQNQNLLDHGESVRDWYEDLRHHVLEGGNRRFEWRLTSWLDSESVRQHFLTADDEIIRLYQIYHDCGKPLCREVDADGWQHFPNHAEVSKQTWLKHSDGSPSALAIGDLIGMDMDIHRLKACEVEEFAAHRVV